MELKLHTTDIQRLVMALLDSSSFRYGIFNDDKLKTDAELRDAYNRIGTALCGLNKLCSEENNYTITLTVSESVEKQ